MSNYTIISNDLITANISNGAYRLAILLQSKCYGEKIECWYSQKELAKMLNRSVRTIQRYLKELYEAKIISRKRRGSISNIYTILVKKAMKQAQELYKKAKKVYSSDNKKSNEKCIRFNDFPQREYDYDALEKKLLGWE